MDDPLLSVHDLSRSFGAFLACDRVSLDLRAGEIHALIGPNGAGKSTLIKQIAGELAPDSGSIRFLGRDVTRLGTARRARMGLARTFQVSSVVPEFTVRENLVLALASGQAGFPGVWSRAMTDSALTDGADAVVARLGLAHRSGIVASELAHAERRKVEIAMVLAQRPKAFLLDEPMAGIGTEGSAEMTDLLADLRHEAPVLLVEHDMDAVFRLADRITVLVSGRVIASDTPERIRANADVRRAYLGDGPH